MIKLLSVVLAGLEMEKRGIWIWIWIFWVMGPEKWIWTSWIIPVNSMLLPLLLRRLLIIKEVVRSRLKTGKRGKDQVMKGEKKTDRERNGKS